MTSATYPNHATFGTGAEPARPRRRHATGCRQPGRVVPAWKLGPRVPTLFDACRAAGRSSAAVARRPASRRVSWAPRTADTHWPPDGVPPDGTRRDAMGYVDDRDTIVEIVDALDADPDLVDQPAQRARHRRARATVPTARPRWPATARPTRCSRSVRDHIDWDDTVWIIVSDHDQETVVDREPIDLRPEIDAARARAVRAPRGQRDRRLRRRRATTRARWLDEVDGVEGTAPFDLADARPRVLPGLGEPGRAFGFTGDGHRAGHPRRAPHARAGRGGGRRPPGGRDRWRAALRDAPVEAADWAPDDRRAPRPRAPRPRPDGRSLEPLPPVTRRRRVLDQRRRHGVEAGHRPCPRTLAASSARRSATRSSASATASNASTSSASITPPWNSSVVSLRAESSARYVGIGREQVALRGDVPADEERDPGPEQRRTSGSPSTSCAASRRSVQPLGDALEPAEVVHETRDLELDVVGVRRLAGRRTGDSGRGSRARLRRRRRARRRARRTARRRWRIPAAPHTSFRSRRRARKARRHRRNTAYRAADRAGSMEVPPPDHRWRRFMVAVAQLARAPGCGPGGRGFETPRSPQKAEHAVDGSGRVDAHDDRVLTACFRFAHRAVGRVHDEAARTRSSRTVRRARRGARADHGARPARLAPRSTVRSRGPDAARRRDEPLEHCRLEPHRDGDVERHDGGAGAVRATTAAACRILREVPLDAAEAASVPQRARARRP